MEKPNEKQNTIPSDKEFRDEGNNIHAEKYLLESLAEQPELSERIAPPPPLKPLNLSALCAEDDDGEESRVVPVHAQTKRPPPYGWFRMYPRKERWKTYYWLKPGEGRWENALLVVPQIAKGLEGLAKRFVLAPYQLADGTLGFWPLGRMAAGTRNSWTESAWTIAFEAVREWRRVVPNMVGKTYMSERPVNPKPDPVWPEWSEIEDLLKSTLRDRIIDTADHEELRKLRME